MSKAFDRAAVDKANLALALTLIRKVAVAEADRGVRYEYPSTSINGGVIISRRGDLCDMRDALLRVIDDVAQKAGVPRAVTSGLRDAAMAAPAEGAAAFFDAKVASQQGADPHPPTDRTAAMSYAEVCKEAARHWEFAATFAARHNQSDNGAAYGAAALRALAGLMERAKRLNAQADEDDMSPVDFSGLASPLIRELAAGYRAAPEGESNG